MWKAGSGDLAGEISDPQVITPTSRGFYTAQPSVRRLATGSGDRTPEHTQDRASIWVGKLDVPGGFEGVELSAVQSVERVGVSRVEQNEPVGGIGVAQNLPMLDRGVNG